MVSYHINNYYVMKRNDGKWYIEHYDANAQMFTRAITELWCPVEPFDSFIKAVTWLKLYWEELM